MSRTTEVHLTSVKLGPLDHAKLLHIMKHEGVSKSDALRLAIRDKHDRITIEQAEPVRRVG